MWWIQAYAVRERLDPVRKQKTAPERGKYSGAVRAGMCPR